MSVRKQGRRKITLAKQHFVWLYEEDRDLIHVISDDKKLNIEYRLHDHYGGMRRLFVLGGQGWSQVQTPHWTDANIITPGFIRKLILWYLTENNTL